MRRLWQIWLVFVCGLAAAFAAMGWLSLKALDLERDREQARVEAELEEDVRQALWRVDSLVMPILTQESAWPQFAYRPNYSRGKGDPIPSPLLNPSNEFVLLNFETDATKKITSPQAPPDAMRDWAVKNGRLPDELKASKRLVLELQSLDVWDALAAQLPLDQPITIATSPQTAWYFANAGNSLTAANTYSGVTSVNGGELSINPENSTLGNQGAVNTSPGPSPQNKRPSTGDAVNNDGPSDKPRTPQPVAEQANPQQDNSSDGTPQQAENYAQRAGRGRGDNNPSLDPVTKNSLNLAMRSQAYNQNQVLAIQQQRLNNKDANDDAQRPAASADANVRQGLGKAVWVKSSLLFARRVTVNDKTFVQGCWLNWPKLREWLTSEVQTTLPNAELLPIASPQEETRGRMLATLPVRLAVPPAVFEPTTWKTPIRFSLLVAWGCALVGALAVGVLLWGVVALSERRAAFVSAVTHELRTPLTTFRMYAEMLSEGMVNDPAQQKHYVSTLRAEADRLSHLVANVLAYARLERGKVGNRLKPVTISEIVEHGRDHLEERAKQSEMELLVEIDPASLATVVSADVAAVEQILFNLVDNAGKYAASASDRRIHLRAEVADGWAVLRVSDHGPGVSRREAGRLFQPFRKSAKDAANSAPGVGLGLALSRRLARDLGGDLTVENAPGEGACFALKLARAK